MRAWINAGQPTSSSDRRGRRVAGARTGHTTHSRSRTPEVVVAVESTCRCVGGSLPTGVGRSTIAMRVAYQPAAGGSRRGAVGVRTVGFGAAHADQLME